MSVAYSPCAVNGLKSDFGGHNNNHCMCSPARQGRGPFCSQRARAGAPDNNVYAYVGENCFGKGNYDAYYNNSCVVGRP